MKMQLFKNASCGHLKTQLFENDDFPKSCVFRCPHVSTKNGVFKKCQSAERLQKLNVTFSSDTCGPEAKTGKKPLRFQTKTVTCGRAKTVHIPQLHERFLLVMVIRVFENVASPACAENHMCGHPRTDDAINLHFVAKSSAR